MLLVGKCSCFNVDRNIFNIFPYEWINSTLNGDDLSFLNIRRTHVDYPLAEIYNILLNGHYTGMETFKVDADWKQCMGYDNTDNGWYMGQYWELSVGDECFVLVCFKIKIKSSIVLGLAEYIPLSCPWHSHPSITRFYTHRTSRTDWFWKIMNLGSNGCLTELNVKARGYRDTQLRTYVCLSPQIIKGCIMNKPW